MKSLFNTIQIEQCKNDTLVFEGDNCVSNSSDFLLKFK